MVENKLMSEFTEFEFIIPEVVEAYAVNSDRIDSKFDLNAPNRIDRLQRQLMIPFPIGWKALDNLFYGIENSNEEEYQKKMFTFWTNFSSTTRRYVKNQCGYRASNLKYFLPVNLSLVDSQYISNEIENWFVDTTGEITTQEIMKNISLKEAELLKENSDLGNIIDQESNKRYTNELNKLNEEFRSVML